MKLIRNISLVFLSCITSVNAQIVTDNTVTPVDAVHDHLKGQGVLINSVNFSGTGYQIGSYDAGSSSFPFMEGVLMATGDVALAEGPNTNVGMTQGTGTGGDMDIEQLMDGGTGSAVSYDAAILEMEFVALMDTFKLKYIFASEEWNEYIANTIVDGVGIFISGPGITGSYSSPGGYPNGSQNIAVIPTTNQIVNVNTINNGATNTGPCLNCGFFVSNDATSATFADIEFDGYTIPMIASIPVECGETYHVKIVIADATDNTFDSGLFFPEHGMFTTGSDIDYDVAINDVCLPNLGSVEFLNITGGANSYFYSIDAGASWSANTFFDNLLPGFYPLVLKDTTGCGVDTLVEIYSNSPSAPQIVNPGNLCYGDQLSIAGTSQPVIWVDESGNVVQNGTSYVITYNDVDGNYIYASYYDVASGCYSLPDSSLLSITEKDISFIGPNEICEGEQAEIIANGSGIVEWFGHPAIIANNGNSILIQPNSSDFYSAYQIVGSCTYVDSIGVQVNFAPCDEEEISNAFSPNDDGVNDYWYINVVNADPSNRVRIFNRWGDEVRDIIDYNNNDVVWDGTDNKDRPLGAGTYFYVIELETLNRPFTGWVQITKE